MRLKAGVKVAVSIAVVVGAGALWTANAWAYTCADFQAQAQAQQVLRADLTDPNGLDPDHNGIACDSFAYPAGRPTDLTPVSRAGAASSAPASRAATPKASVASARVATAASAPPTVAGSTAPLAKTGLVHVRQFVLMAIMLIALGTAVLSARRASDLKRALQRFE